MATSPNAKRDPTPQSTRAALERWLEEGRDLLSKLDSDPDASQVEWDADTAANQGPPDFAPEDLQAAQREVLSLRSELESLEIAHFELVCRNLGTLRLHSCQWLGEVLDTLVEIALNFIGVGNFVIYLASEDASELHAVVHEGDKASGVEPLDASVIESLSKPRGINDELLVSVGDEMGVLPFFVEDRLVGALRMVESFPQKEELTAADHEFLTLLGEHGAIALRRAWMTSTSDQRWWTLTSLKALLD